MVSDHARPRAAREVQLQQRTDDGMKTLAIETAAAATKYRDAISSRIAGRRART